MAGKFGAFVERMNGNRIGHRAGRQVFNADGEWLVDEPSEFPVSSTHHR